MAEEYKSDVAMIGSFRGLFLDYDRISNENFKLYVLNKLNEYSNCNNTGVLPKYPTAGVRVIRGVLIIMHDSVFEHAKHAENESLLSYMYENPLVFEQSLGHCYVTYKLDEELDKDDMCCIYNVCLHNNYLEGGSESTFIESIVDSLNTSFPMNAMLWITVDIKNKQFVNVANLYATFGFIEPYFTKKDPYNNTISNHSSIALVRKNEYIDSSYIFKEQTLREIIYIFDQHKLSENQPCIMKLMFETKYARWLQKLLYNSRTLNGDGTVSQKEFAGSFNINKNLLIGGEIVWKITSNPKSHILSVSEDNVVLPANSRYSFHTHPNDLTVQRGYVLSRPSWSDFVVCLENFIGKNMIFHSVVVPEGMYIISLQQDWISNKENLDNIIRDHKNVFLNYIKNNFEMPIDANTGRSTTNLAHEYVEFVNNMELIADQPPVFHLTFLEWGDIYNEIPFSIYYPVIEDECFLSDKSLENRRKYDSTFSK
jgi:hypothetical protein